MRAAFFVVKIKFRILAERNTQYTWRDILQILSSKIKGWSFWFSSVVCFATTIDQPFLFLSGQFIYHT